MAVALKLPQAGLLQGSTQPILWKQSFGNLIDRQAELFGDQLALISCWQSARITYRQLAKRSLTVAAALLALGLRHGDSIGILGGNRYEYIETFLGAARLGCPVVVLNSLYTPKELEDALNASGESAVPPFSARVKGMQN